MIKIEKIHVYGFQEAAMAVRNPYDSWDKSDSGYSDIGNFELGQNDLTLMKKLANAGPDHGKILRTITVYMDITAPLYWWKEFDTYKVGTVANSCSTMHTIMKYEFSPDMFSIEDLKTDSSVKTFDILIDQLNWLRNVYLTATGKIGDATLNKEIATEAWREMIQLLPSSFNQKRSVVLNYAVLRNMYHSRKDHKLDEWRAFCDTMTSFPFSELITGE